MEVGAELEKFGLEDAKADDAKSPRSTRRPASRSSTSTRRRSTSGRPSPATPAGRTTRQERQVRRALTPKFLSRLSLSTPSRGRRQPRRSRARPRRQLVASSTVVKRSPVICCSALALLSLTGAQLSVVSATSCRARPTGRTRCSVFLLSASPSCRPPGCSRSAAISASRRWRPAVAARPTASRLLLVDVVELAVLRLLRLEVLDAAARGLGRGHVHSLAWAPPLWIPYSLMAVGMTLLTVQILLQVLPASRRRSRR